MSERVTYLDSGGTGREVVEMFAWLAGPPGDEGIVSFDELPLVMAKRELAVSFTPYIAGLAKATGKPCRLVRYGERTVLTEITP